LIYIFSEHITNRLIYVLDFCFANKGIAYNVLTNEQELDVCHINYSSRPIESSVQIHAQGILFESEIYENKSITCNAKGELEIDGVADSFGIVFYLLSRYEEHFNKSKDKHDRFIADNNVLVQNKLQKRPIVDLLVKDFWEKLNLDYTLIRNQFKIAPTFDIDVAWAYKNRTFTRTLGAAIKGKNLSERLSVLSGKAKDPYDTYEDIIEIGNKFDTTRCFILLGDWGPYDKNIHWENDAYNTLINKLNEDIKIGIHPSYNSFLSPEKIEKEQKRLEKITSEKITESRQHFLRMKFPETYQILLQNKIENDYSMGFADQIGFRAGTSFSYFYFDLNTNCQTTLKIHPFAYMDSALKDYLKLTIEDAFEEVERLIKEVKLVGGTFSFIWHNSSINNKGEWKGWKSLLDYSIK